MPELTYTLLSDGSSDRALTSIIDWTIQHHFPDLLIQSQWANLGRLPVPPPANKLNQRIEMALELYPCDWLFIHRDAEGQSVEKRQQEINDAWQVANVPSNYKTIIPIIPVRMTEAWLLINESAIRKAASNSNGRQVLSLPPIRTLENLPDPKQTLRQLLQDASGLTGRRLQRFNVAQAIHLVAQNISDYSPLRSLSAFAIFEKAIQELQVHLE